MNAVRKSLYLCIGVLLALIGLQAAQSLFQVNQLADASNDIAAGARVADDARQIWTTFVATEQVLRRATDFTDAEGAGALRKAFGEQAGALRGAVGQLRADAQGDLQQAAEGLSKKVDAWLAMASRHVGSEGVTELPSYHLLDAARGEVDAQVSGLVTRSTELAAATVAAGQALQRRAIAWTLGELALAVGLGLFLGWRALRGLHQQLGADATEVARVANAVADGDLRLHLATEGLPPGSVMAAMARMQAALRGTVSQVLGISASLADGSREIATGNNDLSQRTEQQAAALERTAATMDELGTTVRHNADNAAEASRLADEAGAVATRGGSVVRQAVETMRGINESSRRIADIIGVIDGIAFQTNILALNAAVEAARAGDQGRGFAVVASEVRALAQRSAEAARQIKALITASVERVEAGSTYVDQAGQTMQEVAQAIERVTTVMAEIRHASTEQSAGVTQVGQAVAELDRATQQNAALAEQSAAAAESLKVQGQQLAQAMTFFRLADHAAATAPAEPAAWGGEERRGPGRATNVVRTAFAPPAAAAPVQPRLKTGTGDDWATF